MIRRSNASLPSELVEFVLRHTRARSIDDIEPVQTLWSGYGQLLRLSLTGAEWPTVIVKRVQWPTTRTHPRGWNSSYSHERKVRSYRVEEHWYRAYAARCDPPCRVPRCLAADRSEDGVVLLLEDLDAVGFDTRRESVGPAELEACLTWLAEFHAEFMGAKPDGLWNTGTYWHLATRPDELSALEEGPLKHAAAEIDRRLNECEFRTLVHGDAKLANFCFSPDGHQVAAVDFQYVGGGCGMKDLAYFISSCMDESEAEHAEASLLDRYFRSFRAALGRRQQLDFAKLETEWRALYPVAWTDFYRFLKGWSPGHWKLHRYSERMAREVLATIMTNRNEVDGNR